LARDPERYQAAKHAVAASVIAALDERFPGLAAAVEVTDVATPMTWVRHTANWRGAFEGWLPTRATAGSALRGARRTLPGLANFFMVGQWAGFGGLPSVASDGRSLIKELCKQEHRPFVTTRAAEPPARPPTDTVGGASAPPALAGSAR